MLEKLEQIEKRYEEMTNELSSPELLANPSAYGKAAKQHRALGDVVEKYRQLKSLKDELVGAREMLEIVDDDGQPRSSNLAVLLDQLDAQLRMICLPDGV